MGCQERLVSVGRSVQLLVREFQPRDATDRTCIVVHGAAEHGGRHQHIADRLCRAGWRVLVPDLRGHGRSTGRPMHLLRFGQYVDDLARIYDAWNLVPESTAQIGYSLGGLVTTRFAQRHPGRCQAMALACPLLGLRVHVPTWIYASGRALSLTYPWKRFSSVLNPADVTRCPISIAERQSDPLYRHGVTAGWYFAVQRAIAAAWNEAREVSNPILMVQSGEDRVVDGDAGRHWLEQVASRDVEFQELPGHFHEWHFEPTWAKTTDSIGQWLGSRLAPSMIAPSTIAVPSMEMLVTDQRRAE